MSFSLGSVTSANHDRNQINHFALGLGFRLGLVAGACVYGGIVYSLSFFKHFWDFKKGEKEDLYIYLGPEQDLKLLHLSGKVPR